MTLLGVGWNVEKQQYSGRKGIQFCIIINSFWNFKKHMGCEVCVRGSQVLRQICAFHARKRRLWCSNSSFPLWKPVKPYERLVTQSPQMESGKPKQERVSLCKAPNAGVHCTMTVVADITGSGIRFGCGLMFTYKDLVKRCPMISTDQVEYDWQIVNAAMEVCTCAHTVVRAVMSSQTLSFVVMRDALHSSFVQQQFNFIASVPTCTH